MTERDDPWAPLFDYWTSIATAADPDQVAVEDTVAYNDTDENWPLKQGFGALISRYGADLGVSLNSAVRRIEWGGPEARIHTAKGTVTARRVLVTVSTGILGAGDIDFDPALPQWKLDAIAAKNPDLAILDCGMPGNGILALRQIRQSPRFYNLPVVMLTARRGPGDVEIAMREGATAYVKKPFDPHHLVFRIEEILEKKIAGATGITQSLRLR